MANFWGDLSKGVASGFDIGNKMQAQWREREEHERRKEEWARLDQQRQALQAAGNVIDDPQNPNGLLTADQYKQLAKPAKKGKKAAMPMGDDIAPREPPAVLATQSLAPGADPEPPVAMQTGASGPVVTKPDDYTAVVVGDQIMYAPRQRVKQLDGPDLVRARAKVLGSFDPVIGAQLMVAANSLEKGNIETASARWGQSVMEARRVAQADPVRGLQMLNQSYSANMPDLGEMEFEPGKDGGIKVTQYVRTKGGRIKMGEQNIPAVNPDTGLSALDTIFTKAQSLGSPEAYRQHLMDTVDFASKTADLVFKKQQTAQEADLFPLRKQGLQEGIETQRYNRRSDAARTYYDTGIDLEGTFRDNVDTIMQAEGTAQANGWNTILGDRPGGGNSLGVTPPKPITQMTLGELYNFQRNVLLPASGKLNSTAAGGLQITSENIKRFGKVLGDNWQNQKFTPENQIKIAEAIHAEQGYGAWEGLKRGGAMPSSPRARDQMIASGRTGAPPSAANQKNIASYVAEGLKNIDAPPGSPERAHAVAALQSEAMQIYGAFDEAPVAMDLTTKGQKKSGGAIPSAQAAQAPAKPAKKAPAKPAEPKAVAEARGAMKLGGEAGRRARERFENKYGIPPSEAVKNPKAIRGVLGNQGRVSTTIKGSGVTRAQLQIDANAAIAQGPKAVAEFKRKYGQPPERFVKGS